MSEAVVHSFTSYNQPSWISSEILWQSPYFSQLISLRIQTTNW